MATAQQLVQLLTTRGQNLNDSLKAVTAVDPDIIDSELAECHRGWLTTAEVCACSDMTMNFSTV